MSYLKKAGKLLPLVLICFLTMGSDECADEPSAERPYTLVRLVEADYMPSELGGLTRRARWRLVFSDGTVAIELAACVFVDLRIGDEYEIRKYWGSYDIRRPRKKDGRAGGG